MKIESVSKKEWFIIDAQDAVLGRLATKIATVLRGKHKPTYLPYKDNGDYIVVINAKNIAVTGNKLNDKIYYKHTGYIGNMKKTPLSKALTKNPSFVIKNVSFSTHKIHPKLAGTGFDPRKGFRNYPDVIDGSWEFHWIK